MSGVGRDEGARTKSPWGGRVQAAFFMLPIEAKATSRFRGTLSQNRSLARRRPRLQQLWRSMVDLRPRVTMWGPSVLVLTLLWSCAKPQAQDGARAFDPADSLVVVSQSNGCVQNCTPGTWSCFSDRLMVCEFIGNVTQEACPTWTLIEACESDQVCDATAQRCLDAGCADGVQNAGESDVDCGGFCAGCEDGASCTWSGDCLSGSCSNGECLAASCSDGVVNGDESDRDCGGSCSPCEDLQRCNLNADCASKVCTLGFCAQALCEDGVLNGDESDLDCGGSCAPCPIGGVCRQDADCAIGGCEFERCTGRCLEGFTGPGCDLCEPAHAGEDCALCSPGQWCPGGDIPAQGCGVETFDDDQDPATVCVSATTCAAGEWVLAELTSVSDRECAPCPDGTWDHDADPYTSCELHSICQTGEYEVAAPTTLWDRECAACSDGTWDHDANPLTECIAHTECVSGQTQSALGDALTDARCEWCLEGSVDHDADPDTLCQTSSAKLVAGDGFHCLLDGESLTCSSLAPGAGSGSTAIIDVAANADTLCALGATGQVRCWGDSFYSGTGLSAWTNTVAIELGEAAACALFSNGRVQCVGEPEVMDGASAVRGVQKLSVGDTFACALQRFGIVSCWGDEVPQGVDGLPALVSIQAGYGGLCGVDEFGAVHCTEGVGPARELLPASQLAHEAGIWCAHAADASAHCWGEALADIHHEAAGPFARLALGTGTRCGLLATGVVECVNIEGP